MSDGRPTIPVGDIARAAGLRGIWLKILNFFKGWRIKTKYGDILLDEKPGATAPRTGLDQPHRIEPPKVGGRRPL